MKSKSNRKASIFYLGSNLNAGDAAIGLGAMALLENQGFDIIAVSRWPASFPEFHKDKAYYGRYFSGLDFQGSSFVFRRSSNAIGLIYNYLRALIQFIFGGKAKYIHRIIADSDVVIFNGGNLIRCESLTDFIRLFPLVIFPALIAKKLNVPYVFLPQSTANINFIGKWLIGYILENAKAIWARERISQDKFKSFYPKLKIHYGPDMAFNINKPEYRSYQPDADNNSSPVKIALTFRSHTIGDIKPLESYKVDEIIRTVSNVLSDVTKTFDCNITIVIQTNNDLQFSKQVGEAITADGLKYSILDTRDANELIKFYATQDLVLGMRLHSIILALSVGTPCVGYFERGWGLKNPGVLEMFNLPFFFINENNEEFSSKVTDIVKNRSELRSKISCLVNDEKLKFDKEFSEII